MKGSEFMPERLCEAGWEESLQEARSGNKRVNCKNKRRSHPGKMEALEALKAGRSRWRHSCRLGLPRDHSVGRVPKMLKPVCSKALSLKDWENI